MYTAFELVSIVAMLSMNIALVDPDFKVDRFEKALPPQHTFEVMTDILGNSYLRKDSKIQAIEVMNRLIQLDVIPRFTYATAKRNPYFAESAKYHQLFTELFTKMVRYHTVDKLKPRELGQDAEMADENDPERCSDEHDFMKSQSFLSDFLGFLEDIAKVKQRNANLSLFSQITSQVVDVISVRYT